VGEIDRPKNEGPSSHSFSRNCPRAVLAVKASLRRAQRGLDCFYEKVIKVKADVAALVMFDVRHIFTEKFALGSLRSDDWQLGRPIASPLLSVFPRNLASSVPCCIYLAW
jgi:hypothetical protein